MCYLVLNEHSSVSKNSIAKVPYVTLKESAEEISDKIAISKIIISVVASIPEMTPIYRTKDQEYAFRQIEDVHNYSKLNRYRNNEMNCLNPSEPSCDSNSSNQDEDEDEDYDEFGDEDEEDVKKKTENLAILDYENDAGAIITTSNSQKNEEHNGCSRKMNEGHTSPPEHHARRPMNAFLIFCKRHRCIVKDKYKNYENRAITKILGEWWASLDANDKKCYVNLAKQNKDAFFSANPNFKWYKLPAPSLRSLNTRPAHGDREVKIVPQNTLSDIEKVSYFKLADETQMGGLNNLMHISQSRKKIEQKEFTDESLYLTSDCKVKSFFTEGVNLNSKGRISDNSSSNSDDDLFPRKLIRSCKGKKYQEFINAGKITSFQCKNQNQPICVDNNPFVVMRGDATGSSKNNDLHSREAMASSWVVSHYKDSDDYNKQKYSFVSFDLDTKISRLPAQCLETYLQRKRTTKRKKKLNCKKHSPIWPPKVQEEFLKRKLQCSLDQKPKPVLEVREQMVGSQKRKARKESITRRDISSLQNDVQVLVNSSLVTTTNGKDSSAQSLSSLNKIHPSDLLILAEVAANRTEST